MFFSLIFALSVLCCTHFSSKVVDAKTDPIIISTGDEDDELDDNEEEVSETQAEINAKYEAMGYPISKNIDIADEGLYKALLSIVKEYAQNVNGETFTGDTLYSEMLDMVTTIEIGHKYNISSLAGMEKLELSNLETLSITRNSLTVFDGTCFQNTTEKFTSINLASNKISTFRLGNLEYLRTINLSNNELKELDLSGIEGTVANTPITLNLAGNYISSMSKIKLPTKRIGKITMNLIANNITEVDDAYFNTNKYDISLGLQGFRVEDGYGNLAIETKAGIKLYKSNIPNLIVKIYKDTEECEIEYATYSDADITDGNYITIDTQEMGVGEYRIEYMLGDELAYLKSDVDRAYYNGADFIIKPTKATYQLEYKGQMYDKLNKVTGEVKVHLSAEVGATIYYSVNGKDYTEYTETINCDKGGNYSVRYYTKIGDYESDIAEVYIKTSLNTYIPDGLMFALLLIVSITLFVVVIPIVSRKFFKHN